MFNAKGQGNLQHAEININYTDINICLNSWSKFLLYNSRQPSKALKFNPQLSKLEKLTVNRQSCLQCVQL